MKLKIFKTKKKEAQVIDSYNALLSQWDVDYTEKDIETDYGITHFIQAGRQDSPSLLLFHGVGDNSACMWLPNIKPLSEHFYCFCIDTLGGPGKSVPNENYAKNFNQEDWIRQIIEKISLQAKPRLLGISHGANMAFNFTAKFPELVQRCVCLEGGMIANPGRAMAETLKLLFPEILLPTQGNLLKIMAKLTHPGSGMLQAYPEVVEHMILVMKNHNRGAMFRHKINQYNQAEGLRVKEKLYFLLGELNVLRRTELLRNLADGRYRYRIIKKAGHAVNHEQPDEVNREIIGFLAG